MGDIAKLFLTFDDVLLRPQYSEIDSRLDVDASTRLGNMRLLVPIVSANMDTVTEVGMAHQMDKIGGLGILHRYAPTGTVIEWIRALKHNSVTNVVASIGVQPDDIAKAFAYIDAGANGICVDVAHGDSAATVKAINSLRSLNVGIQIIAGNVATGEGALRLAQAGAHIIKIGIGPGSLCSTRVVTGHGVPQLSAILEVDAHLKHHGIRDSVSLIADGGIRYSGDIVKALAAGADAVMLGKLLAGCDEAPGETVAEWKVYRGMASKAAQMAWRGKVGNGVPEGEETRIPRSGPVREVLAELVGGLRSGMSYSGVRTVKDLQENAVFQRVSSNTLIENHPHAKR